MKFIRRCRMCLSSSDREIIRAIYDYNKIPLFILDSDLSIKETYFTPNEEALTSLLSAHIISLTNTITTPAFDILCYENELYFIFKFSDTDKTCYLFGGPMLLTGLYHFTEMKTLSFADRFSTKELKNLVELLPTISFSAFYSCLRILMLLLKKEAPSMEELQSFHFSDPQGTFHRHLIHELFDNAEYSRPHTPYSQELAVLSCIKEGNLKKLEATYRALPQIKYGNMSSNPLRQLFYGCIANTTLTTRYAIEGGLEEETAFTLSDVYIQQMEQCRTLYELNVLNEKMAIDFTTRVAKVNASKKKNYSIAISQCLDFIEQNIHTAITLDSLAKEVTLTPKYLSHLFKKETGQTITSYIQEKRVDEAKDLLLYSQFTYGQIAHSLCFSSQSYFISVFKKRTGMTPKEYRKKGTVSK